MERFELTVKAAVGIHARPAALLSEAASAYKSRITVEKEGRTANAKRLMELMTLGARRGDRVVFTVEGPDEEEAAGRLKEFCWNNL